ncbi:MAG: cofactor-independent phosphoglycerate mutase [Candidatus Methanoperedens sp.]|jgi:2,3-bisphosphoglycerate-independent phosphoglycerate mutase|nr:cofactor-independent phosphoglycerate mutase [Candidatus Methanoperedens sp.]PKL52827.1 MAG: cofactor-independent phosphoglycerate mutase [Candidatus Methanoperedenaceae archaeon HGW-Methanoperedenaceae-1]
MKYIVLIGDGMADYPIDELGNLTPLQAANTPNMDFIAKHGRCGAARTVPDDMPAGSDVANLSILGYDPVKYYSGRGPLEAASMGISLEKDDVAFRCNLITEKDGLLADYSAGHISNEEARILIEAVDNELGNGCKFHAGISYRHLLVMKQGEKAECIAPHDVMGQPVESVLPCGDASEMLRELIRKSKPVLEAHDVNTKRKENGKNPANLIWPWGQGKAPMMPLFKETYGVSGSIISAVDLLKGIGKYAGLQVINVPGATGYLDTNFSGKAAYALESLKERDFVAVHVEAPDEAGHMGDIDAKIKAIEDFDEKVVGGMLNELGGFGDFRILVLPDHYTPISVKTHTREPVPFAIYSSTESADYVERFDEDSTKEGVFGEVIGHNLMGMLMK